VVEHRKEYASEWAAIRSLAEKFGTTPEAARTARTSTRVVSNLRASARANGSASNDEADSSNGMTAVWNSGIVISSRAVR